MVNVRRDDDFDDHLWYAGFSDGRTWTPPVKLPRDQKDNWAFPFTLAFDSKGRAATTVAVVSGSGSALGRPKLLRSDDMKAWRVASPDAGRVLQGVPVAGTTVFAANDKPTCRS